MAKSEVKKLSKSQVEITVSVSWEEWQKYLEMAIADISKEIKIEGFRNGKAPRNLVEQKVGMAMILDEAANKTVQKTYPAVLAEQKIEAIGQPKAQINKLAEGNELEYVVVTSVMPAVKIKPWRDVAKKINKEFAKQEIKITDAEIEEELNALANSRVQLVDVDRSAQDGDSVVIDFKVLQGGVPIENGTAHNHQLILGKKVFIPGFEEQVIGMNKGEEKEFELKFPDEYHEKNLAGKPATFQVKLNEVQERKTPEISDAFAKSLGKFEDLEALRKNIREGVLEEKEQRSKEERRTKLLEAIAECAEVEIPEILVDGEVKKMFGEFEMQLYGMGMDMEKYLEHTKKKREDMETEWRPQAQKRIVIALALEQLAKDEEINVPNELIEEEMNKTMARYKDIKDVEKNIDIQKVYTYVKGTLTNEKVFELLESVK